MIVPTLLYRSEKWSLNKNDLGKIQYAKIKLKGVTRLDRLTNEAIREDLKILSMHEKINQYKSNSVQYMHRMHEGSTTETRLQIQT